MAGNPEEPLRPGGDEAPKKPAGPKVKSFSCPACGASVTVKYAGFSMSATCDSCHSVIDTSNNNYAILSRYFAKTKQYNPVIPLGTRGKLENKTWEVIGYMVRCDASSLWYWFEYLLFNPYYGYRWLVSDQGHWMLVKTIKQKPYVVSAAKSLSGREYAEYGKDHYKLFNRGEARVVYVMGEFYWRVVVDSRVIATDYIAPPHMLSREKDDSEIVWSHATYITRTDVEKAFNLKSTVATLPLTYSVGACQPSAADEAWKKIRLLWPLFATILTCACFYFTSTALNLQATVYNGNYTPFVKTTDTTIPVFSLDKNKANVVVKVQAQVENSWFYLGGELVNDETGETFPFENDIEFYSGYDSDGYWSEGSNTKEAFIPSVPAGKYYINFDTENGDCKTTDPRSFTVVVLRDVPSYSNYWWCLFYISIIPVLSWMAARQFEVSRWSNSDFSPYPSSSSD
jgi:hypothetical protein